MKGVKEVDVVKVVGKSHLGEISFRDKIGLVLEVGGEVEHPDKPFSREPACQVGFDNLRKQICFPESSLEKLTPQEIYTHYERMLQKIRRIIS